MEGFLEFLALHAPMVTELLRVRPSTSLEVGCGGANLSIFLSMLGSRATGLDYDSSVLREAGRHLATLGARVALVQGDAAQTPFRDSCFDVVLSQGVLEHFGDEQIEAFLAEGLRVGRRVVASMPNCNYPSRDFGNERLMDASFWRARGEAAVRKAAVTASVRAVDYRRFFDRRHPIRSLLNIIRRRCVFTLLILERN